MPENLKDLYKLLSLIFIFPLWYKIFAVVSLAILIYFGNKYYKEYASDTANRPYISIEKFYLERNNNLLIPIDTITLYLINHGTTPANDVKIYLDIFDEADIKSKIYDFPFRYYIPGSFSMIPKESLKIENKILNTSIILDKKKHDEWAEKEELKRMNERMKYHDQHKQFPRQDIIYVKLEIDYRGIQKVSKPPFYFKAVYHPELNNNEIVWRSNNSEIK